MVTILQQQFFIQKQVRHFRYYNFCIKEVIFSSKEKWFQSYSNLEVKNYFDCEVIIERDFDTFSTSNKFLKLFW